MTTVPGAVRINVRLGGLPRRSIELLAHPAAFFCTASLYSSLRCISCTSTIPAPPATPTNNTWFSAESPCSRRSRTGSHGNWTSWRRPSTLVIRSHGVEFHASATYARRSQPWKSLSQDRHQKHEAPSRPSLAYWRTPTTRPEYSPVLCTRIRFRTGIRWKSPSRTCAEHPPGDPQDSTAIYNDSAGPSVDR